MPSWLATLLTAAATATSLATPPALTFLDLDEKAVTLAQVVGDKPTVLVFLRHFG